MANRYDGPLDDPEPEVRPEDLITQQPTAAVPVPFSPTVLTRPVASTLPPQAPLGPDILDPESMRAADAAAQLTPASLPPVVAVPTAAPVPKKHAGPARAKPATPEEPLLNAEQKAGFEAQKKAVEGQGEAVTQGDKLIARQREELEAHQARSEAQIAAIHTDAAQKKAEADKYLAAERDKYDNMKLTDFWQDKSTASHVLAALSIGLGQFGAALTGSPNAALHIIDTAVERHRQQQMAMIAKQEKRVHMSEADREHMSIELQNQEAGLYRRLGQELDVIGKKKGLTDEQVARLPLRAQLAEKEAKITTEVGNHTEEVVERRKNFALEKTVKEAQAAHARAGAAAEYAGIGKTKAETKKIEAEAGVIAAGGGGPLGSKTMGRAAGKLLDLSQFSAQEQDDVAALNRFITSDPKAYKKMAEAYQVQQDNETSIHAADKSAAESPVSAFLTNKGRQHGILPRSPYEGIKDPALRAAMRGVSLLGAKAAARMGNDVSERAHMREEMGGHGGDTPQALEGKVHDLLTMAGVSKGLADMSGFGQVATAGAEAQHARTPMQTGGAPGQKQGQRKLVNGRPAIVYPDGTFDTVQ